MTLGLWHRIQDHHSICVCICGFIPKGDTQSEREIEIQQHVYDVENHRTWRLK